MPGCQSKCAAALLELVLLGNYKYKHGPIAPTQMRRGWLTGLIREVHTASRGTMVKFRWYGNPITVEGRDVPIALGEFLRLIEGANRVNNQYVRSMARSEFKRRIELASAGRLKPITQIKPVDILNPPPLYEIRWQGITVMERGSDGVVASLDLLIRSIN